MNAPTNRGALVIARRPGESFEIGNHVKVIVESIRSNQVRLTIEAPRDIVILRSEVARRVRAENGGVIPGKEAS